jgi:outer membrane protein assembly factor BamB
VYAYTRSGDTVSAPFLLEKLNAFAYFGGGNRVYCYNLISATMVWQSQAAPIGDFTGIPTIVNGVLYENGTESGTWAFNAQTGEKIWNTTFPNDYYRGSSSSPLYVNNILYTIVASGIYALNGSNGTVIWRYPNTVSYATNPIMAGNLLIVGQQSSTSSIIAINAATGVKVWDDTIYTQICKNPVVYNDLVIFGGADGKIYALNQATGSLAWTKNLNVTSDVFGSAIISPVIYHDLVIVHNRTSGYYGLKAFTGATVWNYAIQTTEVSSPAIGNDRVYFSCSEYPGIKAIALDAATGQVIWKHVFGPSGYTPTPIFAHNLLYFAGSIATPSGYGFQVLNANIGADRGLLGPPGPQQFGVETIVAHDTSYYLAESGMVQ